MSEDFLTKSHVFFCIKYCLICILLFLDDFECFECLEWFGIETHARTREYERYEYCGVTSEREQIG